MADRIQVAMAGLGQWGPNLLRNLQASDAFELAAICDRSDAALDKFRSCLPGVSVYHTIEALAVDPRIDAVVLATPAGMHEEHATLLLEAGKDVLVEKPLAMSLAAARRLVRLSESRGRVLMAGHTFLFNPAVRRVRQEIESGRLGRLQYLSAQRMSLGQVRGDCNALWNLAPHDVSIMLNWLGSMPTSVSARGLAFHAHHHQEDIVLCVLEFPGRVLASIQVSWMNPIKVRSMTLVGSERMLVYDDVESERPLTLYHRGIDEVSAGEPGSFESFQLVIRRGPEEALEVPRIEPLAAEVAHFGECIRSRQTPIGSGIEALRIVSVLEACQDSLRSGGRPVVPSPV